MYKVLNDFIEKNHKNTLYRKGEDYPKAGFKADPKRVEFLQEIHPVYKVAFLGKQPENDQETPKNTEEKPKKRSTKAKKSGDD